MTRKSNRLCPVVIMLASLVLSGCIGGTSQQSAYYVFSSVSSREAGPPVLGERVLGVGPIRIPEFLDRPQIVVRQDKNLLTINEFHRWGDSLEDQMYSLLVENLSVFLNSANVVALPWDRPFSPAFQLYVDLRRLEGDLNGTVTLESVWWIVETARDKRLVTRRTSLEAAVSGSGHGAYVDAMNRLMETFSRQIAEEIRNRI